MRVDGYDSREIDLVHLRNNLGIVLQDSFLFRGTVRENIACAKRDATFAEITEAAKLAGADEFIERLPRGFDTMLEEDAVNLSGGQRQRLAIARALIVDPRILILDEATSALDAESEAIIRRNLRRIANGRTVIIVSHRLSMLSDAESICPGSRSGRKCRASRSASLAMYDLSRAVEPADGAGRMKDDRTEKQNKELRSGATRHDTGRRRLRLFRDFSAGREESGRGVPAGRDRDRRKSSAANCAAHTLCGSCLDPRSGWLGHDIARRYYRQRARKTDYEHAERGRPAAGCIRHPHH